jgi:hypothetical protein
MTPRASLARRANEAFDRRDFTTFDRLRDLDEAVKNLPTEELEALLPQPLTNSRKA